MKKVEKFNGTNIIVCNYCSKEFKWSKSRGYDTYRKYVDGKHPIEVTRSKSRGETQIAIYASPNT